MLVLVWKAKCNGVRTKSTPLQDWMTAAMAAVFALRWGVETSTRLIHPAQELLAV